MTLRGARLLQTADVIVHDRLVDSRVLELARPEARIVDVGKAPGAARHTQEEINRLLIALVQEYRQVVRLKGGDPFIFGRGQEERDALLQAGCAVEVVPGVSSVTGVPTVAGVPLTHRDIASDFAVITGHYARDKTYGRSNWDALARMDTLVILMGMRTAPVIQDALLAAGKPPDTPALIVSWGSWPNQQVQQTDLAHLTATIQQQQLSHPALIVLGDVVHYGQAQSIGNEEWELPVVVPALADQSLREAGLYPLTLTNLQERKVLVVGGGPVGERKCLRLLEAGAQVHLCCPTATPRLDSLAARRALVWHHKYYEPADMADVSLVFAATNDRQVNRQIALDAAARGLLCNVATASDGGHFRVPALTMAEDCVVAVTSRSGNPRVAQQLRDQIQALLRNTAEV